MKGMRPLKTYRFRSSSRKTIILTTGIHGVFQGLEFRPDTEIEGKEEFFNDLETTPAYRSDRFRAWDTDS